MPARNSSTVTIVQAALSGDPGFDAIEIDRVLGILRGQSVHTISATSHEFLDEKAVQGILKCSHQTLWRFEKRGELIPARIGRSRRYSRHQIDEFIQDQVMQAEKRRVQPQIDTAIDSGIHP